MLDVLLTARYEEDECVGAAEISRRAGIYRQGGMGMSDMNDAIVHGILSKLYQEKKVERCKQPNDKGGWYLTDAEFQSRHDNVGA